LKVIDRQNAGEWSALVARRMGDGDAWNM